METLWESHERRLTEAGLRRGSDTSVVLTEDTDSFIIGDRVWVGGTKPGSIAYIGETQFAPGDWAGVVLDEPIGKNDGSVAGSRYFQCEPKRGIFSRLTRLTRQPLPEAMLMSPSGEKTPTSPPNGSRANLNKSMSPSLNTSTTSLSSVSQKDVRIGDRVIVSSSQGSKTGVLRFMGTTEFAAGEWCGIELDDPVGKNDGSIGDIRYFECRPRYGLFAPLHKVSRSPSSRRTSTMCVVHKPTGASMNASFRRLGGSRESLASVSSMASTNASIVTRGITSGSRRPGLRASTPARSSMQEMLKEKQQEIEMLRKERDFERERISKVANQADNAEQSVLMMKYNKYREDMEKKVQEAQVAMAQLIEDRNSLKAHLEEEKQKNEDLLFRFEEESINKDDIQVINAQNENKMKDLEKQLGEERERVVQLEQDKAKLLATEEELTKLRNELLTTANHEKREIQDIQNRNLCLEEAKITLEKQMLERNDLIESYTAKIKEFEVKLKELESEDCNKKLLENNYQKKADDMQKNLLEKSSLIEKMKKDHEIDATTLKKEIEQLKEIIENITKESAKDKELLAEENRNIIAEKERIMASRITEFEAETERLGEMHKMALEKLRVDSDERVNQLVENVNTKLLEKELKITNAVEELKVKSAEIEKLVKELSMQRDACRGKDEELKILMERVEELSGKLKTSEDANVELRNQINGLQSQWEKSYSSFGQEKQKLEESVASLLASSADSSERIEKLNKDLKTKEEELLKLRDAKTAEIEELKKNFQSQIEDKTKYIREINADISQKSIRLNALETEIANLKAILASKDKEIENLSKKMSELQDAITLSEQTKTNLESELRMYDVNIAELNNKLMRAEEKSTQLIEQKAKLEAEIENVISTSANSSDQLVKYNEDLRTKEKELDTVRDRSFQLENTLASVESKMSSIEDELNKTKDLAEKYRLESEQLRNKITEEIQSKNTMSTEIVQLRTKEQELLKTIEEKNKLDEDMEVKIIEISELTKKLHESEENEIIMKDKYSSLQKEYDEREKNHENLRIDLENKISLLDDENKKLQIIGDNLTTQRVEMEQSFNELKKNYDFAIEDNKKLETSINEKNSHLKTLESEMIVVKNERDEACQNVHSMSTKYNETLAELEQSNSSRAHEETENSLELIRLKDQLVRADLDKKNLTNSLEKSETLTKEMKEKLENFTEILKKTEIEESEISLKLRESQDSVKNLEKLLENSQKEFNEKLDERNRVNDDFQKRIGTFELELSDMKLILDEKNKIIEEITGKSESMKMQLEGFANINKTKEEQNEHFTNLANDVQRENKTLNEKIHALNEDQISREIVIEEMRKEIENLREIQANVAKDYENEKANLLTAKQNEIKELDKQNENLRNAKFSMEKTLKTEEEKIVSLSTLLNNTEITAAKNVQSFEEQLSLAKLESVRLKENQNRLEKENKQIIEKWNKALEELKTFHENAKNNQENENYPINQKIQSAGGDMNQNSDHENELRKLADENETYRNQIDFLNSVIVDMQRKNETLACKIEVLQIGVPADEADDYSRSTLDKRTSAPRMFCDICDQFDLHETEDCPRQAQDFEELEQPKKSPKKPSVERPYCENCERFGHDTVNCDDTETF